MAAPSKNKLSVIYDKRQSDFVATYPRSHDGSLAFNHLINDRLSWRLPNEDNYPSNYEVENFIKELERRGYDITTFRFSIELKKHN